MSVAILKVRAGWHIIIPESLSSKKRKGYQHMRINTDEAASLKRVSHMGPESFWKTTSLLKQSHSSDHLPLPCLLFLFLCS